MSATSLHAVVDAIVNNVYAGSKAPNNFSLSIEQVGDDFINLRNSLLPQALTSGVVSRQELFQKVCLEFVATDASVCCDNKSNKLVHRTEKPYPKLLDIKGVVPVGYIGPLDQSMPLIKDKQSRPFRYVEYHRVPYLASERHTPPTLTQDADGYFYQYYEDVKTLYLSAMWENPKLLVEHGCYCTLPTGEKYAEIKMPSKLIDSVSSKLVERYVRYYKQFGFIQPTTGTDSPPTTSK